MRSMEQQVRDLIVVAGGTNSRGETIRNRKVEAKVNEYFEDVRQLQRMPFDFEEIKGMIDERTEFLIESVSHILLGD